MPIMKCQSSLYSVWGQLRDDKSLLGRVGVYYHREAAGQLCVQHVMD
jgi:hypothetical protein